VALSKDDVKGEHRRRAKDRGKVLAGKSTVNRLELTAPDYGGSPHQKQSDKLETKKIVVYRKAIDALRVDLFLEAHQEASEKIWTWVPPMMSCTGIRKGASITAITTISVICRCTFSAESICCARACACPTSMRRSIRWRSWNRS
jgi:hypothetical protein